MNTIGWIIIIVIIFVLVILFFTIPMNETSQNVAELTRMTENNTNTLLNIQNEVNIIDSKINTLQEEVTAVKNRLDDIYCIFYPQQCNNSDTDTVLVTPTPLSSRLRSTIIDNRTRRRGIK